MFGQRTKSNLFDDFFCLAYVIEQGLSEIVLGLLNGLGALLGIIGTLFYQIFVKRVGLVRTGVIGFWSEFSMLSFCLLSLFVHGTSLTPVKHLTIGTCHQYENLNTQNNAINSVPFYCSSNKISVLLLVIGITLNRFGKNLLFFFKINLSTYIFL